MGRVLNVCRALIGCVTGFSVLVGLWWGVLLGFPSGLGRNTFPTFLVLGSRLCDEPKVENVFVLPPASTNLTGLETVIQVPFQVPDSHITFLRCPTRAPCASLGTGWGALQLSFVAHLQCTAEATLAPCGLNTHTCPLRGGLRESSWEGEPRRTEAPDCAEGPVQRATCGCRFSCSSLRLDCEQSNARVSFDFNFQCPGGSDNEQLLMFVDWCNEFLLQWLLNVACVRAQLLSHVRLFVTWPYGLQPARLLCPWDSPGKNTGVGCHFLLQGIFPTQGSNQCLLRLLHLQVDSLPLSCLGSPFWLLSFAYFSTGYLSFSSWTIGILFCMFFLFLPTQHHLLVEVKRNQKKRTSKSLPFSNFKMSYFTGCNE